MTAHSPRHTSRATDSRAPSSPQPPDPVPAHDPLPDRPARTRGQASVGRRQRPPTSVQTLRPPRFVPMSAGDEDRAVGAFAELLAPLFTPPATIPDKDP